MSGASKLAKAGNRVVFDSTGSYIENKQDGSKLWLRERAGVYVLDVWVKPYSGLGDKAKGGDERTGGGTKAQGFTRQDVPQ